MTENYVVSERHNSKECRNMTTQCYENKFVCKFREEQRRQFNDDFIVAEFTRTPDTEREHGVDNLKNLINVLVAPTSLHRHPVSFGNNKYTKGQFILALCILLHFFGRTSCAVITGQRMPPFLDIEAALESSKCTVREEVVSVRSIHPTLASDLVISPSCVVLRKCIGCCQSDRLICVPTSTYQTSVEVSISQPYANPPSFAITELNFTHHETCECQSRDAVQRCVPKSCWSTQVWDQSTCECKPRCQPEACPNAMYWNPRRCRCECPKCHPNRLFHARFNQNSHTCICTCRGLKTLSQKCERKGAIFDNSTCQCGLMHRRGSNRPH